MEGEYHSLSPGLPCASLLPPLCSLLPSIAANTELPLVEQDLITLHSWQPEAWASPAASAPIRSLHALLPLSLQLLLKSSELSLPSTCVPAELPRHGHLVLCRERPVGFSGPAVHCPQGPLPPHPSGPFPCRLVCGKNSPGGNFIFYCQASPWVLCATTLVCPGAHFPSVAPPLLLAPLRQRSVSGALHCRHRSQKAGGGRGGSSMLAVCVL